MEGLLRLGPGFIEKILKNRGFQFVEFFPSDRILQPDPPTALNLEIFYHQLNHYSFRLLLRDVIAHRKEFNINHLIHYCSQSVAKKYLRFLVDLGIVEPLNKQFFKLTNPNIYTFGETLEWYVAQVFIREFSSPALWGLEVKNLSPGGDLDVITEIDQRLIYVEVKSSPPKGIHLPNVKEFINRVDNLSPDMALFLVDTHLRMENKINLLFSQAMETIGEKSVVISKITRGVFQVNNKVLILNTKPNLISNIRVCLKHYFKNM